MYLNPRLAIENKWIQFPPSMSPNDYERYIQPNAIDITVDDVYQMKTSTEHCIFEASKVMPVWSVAPHRCDTNGNREIVFETGVIYDVTSLFYITVPQGVCANLIIRSSFSRCGVRLSAGLYDSGYTGPAGYSIINYGPPLRTALGTRIAQCAFIASDSAKQYAGGYNQENNGKHWSETTK